MDEQNVLKNDRIDEQVEDKLHRCPNCQRPVIRVGCHAICQHCGYQEGCGD